jgi:hypothetical protein
MVLLIFTVTIFILILSSNITSVTRQYWYTRVLTLNFYKKIKSIKQLCIIRYIVKKFSNSKHVIFIGMSKFVTEKN